MCQSGALRCDHLNERGARGEDYDDWFGSGKKCLSGTRSRCPWQGLGAEEAAARSSARVLRQAAAVPGGDGSVRGCPLLGAGTDEVGPYGEADESAIREAVCQEQQNDANDAEAICEAVARPNMRFVPAKGIEHQDLQAVRRIRQRLIEERTALVNQIRGLLAEYGIVMGKGINQARAGLPVILEDGENGLTGYGRELFNALREELIEVDERIAGFDKRIAAVHAANPLSQKL